MTEMKKCRFIPANDRFTVCGIFIMCLMIILLSITGCRRDGGAGKPKNQSHPVVQIQAVALKTMTRNIALTGSIEPARLARIASPAEGPVLHCTIREGDRVAKDQVLLTLGRKQAAEEMAETARKTLEREEEDLQRIEQLVGSGAIPAEQEEEARLHIPCRTWNLPDCPSDTSGISRSLFSPHSWQKHINLGEKSQIWEILLHKEAPYS